MKITYLFRHASLGFSIQNVFNTVKQEMAKEKYGLFVNTVTCPSERSMPWDIVRNAWYVHKNSSAHSVCHITGHIHDVILGLRGRRVVLTIHDLVFLDNVQNPIKRFYKWLFWLYLPVKLADKITCISQETKNNLQKYIQSDKVVVIHNPISPSFQFVSRSFDKNKPTILHVGTGWNKNLERTIIALKDLPCHLRIIGKINQKVIDLLVLSGIDYSSVHSLSDEQIRMEYANCDVVSFPSIYEGFGMPVIEGQKTGRPVVTSKIEPLIEISGNAVHFVDPYDIASIRDGFMKVIQDDVYREKIISDGLQNTTRFGIDFIAEQYLKVYKSFYSNIEIS